MTESLIWTASFGFFYLLRAICDFLHDFPFPWWPEMTQISYDALCGKHSLQSILPHFSLLIYWPPTPLFFLFLVVQIFLFPAYVLKLKNAYLADGINTVPQQMFLVSVHETATRWCGSAWHYFLSGETDAAWIYSFYCWFLFVIFFPHCSSLMTLWQIWCFCDLFRLCLWPCFRSPLFLKAQTDLNLPLSLSASPLAVLLGICFQVNFQLLPTVFMYLNLTIPIQNVLLCRHKYQNN